ncbi:hypothetical protein Salat_0205500 [Sesamum alatum]|uniref:Uncharacterized protein n=1 Tax=Sesamum alatum TaxID=300844 RepID=A0AAE2CY53_9LAMI|nr:hypothetical protein Salat_0205500 [Sesamum alatum]
MRTGKTFDHVFLGHNNRARAHEQHGTSTPCRESTGGRLPKNLIAALAMDGRQSKKPNFVVERNKGHTHLPSSMTVARAASLASPKQHGPVKKEWSSTPIGCQGSSHKRRLCPFPMTNSNSLQ